MQTVALLFLLSVKQCTILFSGEGSGAMGLFTGVPHVPKLHIAANITGRGQLKVDQFVHL